MCCRKRKSAAFTTLSRAVLGAVVVGTVALDAEEIASRCLGIDDGQVDPVPRASHLLVDLPAHRLQRRVWLRVAP
jgi:hypothetical protein